MSIMLDAGYSVMNKPSFKELKSAPGETSKEAIRVQKKDMKSTQGNQEGSLEDVDLEKLKFPINGLKYNVGGLY